MADFPYLYLDNAPGAFYVDDQCIDCDLCRETAPTIFKRNDDGGHAFVSRQPTTEAERKLCMEAAEGCPCNAIGDDGDSHDWSEPSHAGHMADPDLRKACKQCSRPRTLIGRFLAFFKGQLNGSRTG